ncbi:MAG: hypothetical protein H7Z43_09830, partial [Clostridia bacterium]|nr:hypothetical protein [Deltaproteobacteria bacterium]
TFLLTFAVVPLFGVLNAASALCTAFPKLSFPWVTRATGLLVGIFALTDLVPNSWVIGLAAPPLVILLVDEWLVRRRAAILDSLYEPGPLRISSLIACLAAWTVIALYRETALACVIAAIGAVLPLATRVGKSRRIAPAPALKPAENEWSDAKKLDDADWSPDADTNGK